MLTPDTASREILFNVKHPLTQVIFYLLFFLSMAVFMHGLWFHLQLIFRGKNADDRKFSLRRVGCFLRDVFLQYRVSKDAQARGFHGLIFFGFLVLLFTTTVVFIDFDLGIKIYHGDFYLGITVLSDLFGLGLLVGVMLAYHRRYIVKPDRLHTAANDGWMLAFLAIMTIQGFLLEALRIRITTDPWALFSPIGWILSLGFWGMSEASMRMLHFVTWWMHSITVFLFIAYLPYSKFLHIVFSSANLFYQKTRSRSPQLPYPGDIETKLIEATESDDAEFRIGIHSAQDFTWKQLLDFEACTSCGRCQDACPAYNSGKILSPKWLILSSRNHLLELHKKDASTSLEQLGKQLLEFAQPLERDAQRCQNELANSAALSLGESWEQRIAGEVMHADVFWACTTCRACMEVCPVGIEHVDYIVEARRAMALMEGEIPTEAQKSVRAIETRGNPFGPAEERMDWAKGLTVPILEVGARVEVLYWVGCIAAYDKRKQAIARSMVQILNQSGISWGILGNRECCTGDPARRLGEENVFQTQAKQNISTLNTVGFKTLVTHCPHCFNSFKNDYPDIGSIADTSYRVLHHSSYIEELLEKGVIQTSKNYKSAVTFHDPCYLGRYNNIYEEPREVLVSIGASISEMKESREIGKCCGAGGGHFFMDMKVGERVNVQRVKQATDTGAAVIATACPFCMHMLEDGIKLQGNESAQQVFDIAEIVAQSLLPSSSSQ